MRAVVSNIAVCTIDIPIKGAALILWAIIIIDKHFDSPNNILYDWSAIIKLVVVLKLIYGFLSEGDIL